MYLTPTHLAAIADVQAALAQAAARGILRHDCFNDFPAGELTLVVRAVAQSLLTTWLKALPEPRRPQ